MCTPPALAGSPDPAVHERDLTIPFERNMATTLERDTIQNANRQKYCHPDGQVKKAVCKKLIVHSFATLLFLDHVKVYSIQADT
jgi:hypothetical protein